LEPGLIRAFLPLIKRLMARDGGPENTNNPGLILESRLYKIYRRYLYPLEYGVCVLAKGLFAFRIVLIAEPTNAPGRAYRSPPIPSSHGK